MIQYGTIVHDQNGIACSQSNTIEGTFARCAAIQFANPYEMKNNGASSASQAAARRQGRSATKCSLLPLAGEESGMKALTARLSLFDLPCRRKHRRVGLVRQLAFALDPRYVGLRVGHSRRQ